MDLLDALLDLVLPQSCAGCGVAGVGWCRGCAAVLAAAAADPLGPARPHPAPAGFPRATAAATYDGAVRGALLAHKERGRLRLAGPLGAALAAAVECLQPPGGVILVPAPSSPAAVRTRGHDHAARLASAAAAALRRRGVIATAERLLVPGRAVADQSGLDTAGRASNLTGAMRLRRPVAGRVVVVVDDVVTTGATLTEATRALAAGGAVVHGAATVAATARRRPRGSADLSRRTSVHGSC